MAVNTKNYTCDYCNKGGLEHKDIVSVTVTQYDHRNNNEFYKPPEISSFELCNQCNDLVFKTKDKSLISILKSIWLKIT